MIKYIDHHWASGGVLEFDTVSGSVQSSTKYEWQNTPDWGTAWQHKGRWYVLHNDDESFILQTGGQTWRLTPKYSLTVRSFLFWRKFSISKNGQVLFSLWYIPKYFFFPVVDPAYEEEDEEDNDFFLYVVNIRNMWQNRDYAEFKRNIAAWNEEKQERSREN